MFLPKPDHLPAILSVSLALICTNALCDEPDAQNSMAPYTLTPATDITLSATGFTLSVAGMIVAYRVDGISEDEVANLDSSSINQFDRGATKQWSPAASAASYITVSTAAALPLIFSIHQLATRRKLPGLTLLLMYTETMGINFGVTEIVKGAVRRKRPMLYNQNLSVADRASAPEPRLSFFSAHTSIAFCSAAFLSTTFSRHHPQSPWRIPIWAGTFSLAATTGLLRYTAGKHYPTDILTGAAVGTLFGVLIPMLHVRNNQKVVIYPLNGDIRGVGAAVFF